MLSHDDMLIGLRNGYGGDYPFAITVPDRRSHTYVIGKTGTGKSTLLNNLLIQDIYAGRGVGLIDPHGDLAEALLDQIPRCRTEDVVYFNPSDHEHPVAWNLLQVTDPKRKHLIASGFVGALKNIWRESWGPRMEYILYAAVATLAECENTSILGIARLLADRDYRTWALKQVKDPWLLQYWHGEFARLEKQDPRFIMEAIAPIQNKVGQFLLSPPVRNIFGQVESRVSARFIMDHRRIFIANLAKGAIGEDKANLIGALLVAQFQQAAMSRVDQAEEEREDFHLAIDEFQNFTSDAFAAILSEARKYRLALTLSHQYVAQLSPAIAAAVFGNVGTLLSFRVGETDAAVLEREFGEPYHAALFSGLENHEICVKLLQNGRHQEPFIGRTLPPLGERVGRRATIIARSRERYTRPRALVEAKLARWMQQQHTKPVTLAHRKRRSRGGVGGK